MRPDRLIIAIAALVAMAFGFSVAQLAATRKTPSFFEGKVYDLARSDLVLAKRMDLAMSEAGRLTPGANFFAAYRLQSRHKVRYGRIEGPDDRYVVSAGAAKIRIVEKDREKLSVNQSTDEKDEPSPAVVLVLSVPVTGELVDVSILDPDRVYEFSETPVYWLGDAGEDESFSFTQKSFMSAKDSRLQEKLLFLVSCHPGTAAPGFLKKVAVGSYAKDIRKNAIFWLGNSGDTRSLTDLKEVFKAVPDRDLKEQVVFALQLSKQKEAVLELIRIAKDDPDREVRSKSIFWLGQKASAESVKALKDIVGNPDETDPLKDQAIFAISQLPKNQSIPLLIDIAKTNKSASVRKKAIFWLGQSGDEAALKFFEGILLKK
jgi:hypothetical protein